MNEQEFLQKATSKIYSFRKKQIIAGELHDHILLKKQRFEEAGYTEEQAKEKSVEAMGNAEDIAETLSKLHKSRNVLPELAAFLIAVGLSSAAYYLLRTYAFGDPGVISLLISGIFFGATVFFVMAAFLNARRNITASALILCGGMTTALIRALIVEISDLTNGSFEKLKQILSNNA